MEKPLRMPELLAKIRMLLALSAVPEAKATGE
jgi:hypothetical protein